MAIKLWGNRSAVTAEVVHPRPQIKKVESADDRELVLSRRDRHFSPQVSTQKEIVSADEREINQVVVETIKSLGARAYKDEEDI